MTTPRVGDAVLVFMGVGLPDSPEGIACGARVIAEGDPPWIDLCMIGQHLPQMYKAEEIFPIDIDVCETYGLCPGCLGYGTNGETVPMAAGMDEISDPCGVCTGTGRAVLRVHINRGPGTIEAEMEVLPHIPVLRSGTKNCSACGFPMVGEFAAMAKHLS